MADTDINTNQSTTLPTFSSLQAALQLATRSHPAGRLHWTLSNPSSSSILIMPNSYTPDSPTLTPYTTESSTTHPLSQELMTRPAVRSLQVNVDQLSDWTEDWVDMHREHCGNHDGQRQTVPVTDDVEEGDTEDEDGNPIRIVMCCGERRPQVSTPLEVRASDEGRGVTIGDYVEVVHPWLMERRGEIVAAMKMVEGEVPEDSVLMVNVNAPDALVLQMRERWVAQCRLNAR